MTDDHPIAEAIREAFGSDITSSSVSEAIYDSFRRADNGDQEPATIVDVIETLAESTKRIADSITPTNATPCECPTGEGSVGSLTEAVIGLTRSMMSIAASIERVADAIESR
jgi:hypothetical protein